MIRVLGLSILFYLYVGLSMLLVTSHSRAQTGKLLSNIKKQKAINVKTDRPPDLTFPGVLFLEQAEDIEREAWWVLTDQRIDGTGSPFRVLRAAILKQGSHKTKISFRYCQKLVVLKAMEDIWRIESECQKPNQEVGRLQKTGPAAWRVEWRTRHFEGHFGLGTTVLYPKLSCDIKLGPTGRIQQMVCPLYARNRLRDEVVELKTFEYNSSQNQALLKLKGEVKKDLQVIATLQTEVPLSGDVVVREKKIPQKQAEGQTDFTEPLKSAKPKVETSEEKYGAKKEENSQESHQKVRQEGRNEGQIPIGPQGRQGPLPPEDYGVVIDQEGQVIPGQEYEDGEYPDEPSFEGSPDGPPPIESSPTGR